MMQDGKLKFIKKWGVSHFLYAYLMLLLRRLIGFRASLIRANAINDSLASVFEEDGIIYGPLSVDDFKDDSLNKSLDITKFFVNKALSRGDQCIGALDGGKVVGYVWRTTSTVEVEHPIHMKFGNKLYYRYKGFVLPEYRGRNIFNKLKLVAESPKIKRNRTHSFSVIETHNYPSLTASRKQGDVTIGYSAFIANRFFFVSWRSHSCSQWGIEVYKLIK